MYRCCVAEGDAEEAASDLLRSSTYLDMLHDARRNQAYAIAIKSAVEAVRAGAPILDIGTGTGLLALLAARCEGPLTWQFLPFPTPHRPQISVAPSCPVSRQGLFICFGGLALEFASVPAAPAQQTLGGERRCSPARASPQWRSSPAASWPPSTAPPSRASASWPSAPTSSPVRPCSATARVVNLHTLARVYTMSKQGCWPCGSPHM